MKLNKYKNLVEAIEDMKITIKEFQEKNLTHTKIYKGYVESVNEWIFQNFIEYYGILGALQQNLLAGFQFSASIFLKNGLAVRIAPLSPYKHNLQLVPQKLHQFLILTKIIPKFRAILDLHQLIRAEPLHMV